MLDSLDINVEKILDNPIRYLTLLGTLIDLVPLEMYSAIVGAALAAIVCSSDAIRQEWIVRRFWKPCLAGRASHPERAAAVEKCANDLLEHLISISDTAENSSRKAALRLALYCIRFDHPQVRDFRISWISFWPVIAGS